MRTLSSMAWVFASSELFPQPPHRRPRPVRSSQKRSRRSFLATIRAELSRAATDATPVTPSLTRYPY